MAEPIRVLLAASEAEGFAKTGGLADVIAALPAALARRGLVCAVILPLYRCARSAARPTPHLVRVPLAGRVVEGRLWQAALPGADVPVYLVEQADYFDRYDPDAGRGLYQLTPPGGRPRDYPDNAERFAFFCRAVLEAVRVLDVWPDVLHVHDWHTGLLPIYLREVYRRSAPATLADRYARIRTLFTFHNLAYQGVFPPETLERIGLGRHLFHPGQLEFHGRLNLLKAGLVGADLLSTVSPTYAREVQTPYHGCGLQGVLSQRRDDLFGVVNGVDYRVWDPAGDPHLAAPYGPADLAGKRACKADLQRGLGLTVEPDAPLCGMVARLAEQKGPDLVAGAFPALLAEGAQLVVLGEGDPYYQGLLHRLGERFPGRVSLTFRFNDPLAHRIIAGADLFLMPSLYEPSGLTQLYAMKYGAPGVVRATGGLIDTVVDATPDALAAGTATGFRFRAHTADALREAVRRALDLRHNQPADWLRVVRTGMAQDWSWDRSAAEYAGLYERLRTGPAPRRG